MSGSQVSPVTQAESAAPEKLIPFEEKESSACGIGMIVRLPHKLKDGTIIPVESSHEVVEQGLKYLDFYDYRSGYNPVTGESDGTGIKLYGLPIEFLNAKIGEGQFVTPEGQVLQGFTLEEN